MRYLDITAKKHIDRQAGTVEFRHESLVQNESTLAIITETYDLGGVLYKRFEHPRKDAPGMRIIEVVFKDTKRLGEFRTDMNILLDMERYHALPHPEHTALFNRLSDFYLIEGSIESGSFQLWNMAVLTLEVPEQFKQWQQEVGRAPNPKWLTVTRTRLRMLS